VYSVHDVLGRFVVHFGVVLLALGFKLLLHVFEVGLILFAKGFEFGGGGLVGRHGFYYALEVEMSEFLSGEAHGSEQQGCCKEDFFHHFGVNFFILKFEFFACLNLSPVTYDL